MRSLVLLAALGLLAVGQASMRSPPRPHHDEQHHMSDLDDFDRLMEEQIQRARHGFHRFETSSAPGHVQGEKHDDSKSKEHEAHDDDVRALEDDEGFVNEVENMIQKILDGPLPFFGHADSQQKTSGSKVAPKAKEPAHVEKASNETEPSLVERTKETLEQDVAALKQMILKTRADIDVWMTYPQTRTFVIPMIVGAFSAIATIIVFFCLRSFCTRILKRSRMRRVAAFENELFNGMTKDLLDKSAHRTPRIPRRESNSDEDI